MNYQIKQTDLSEIDLIQPLWEKLNLLHYDLSQNFKQRFADMSWEKRKTKLLDKSEEIMIETVSDENNILIGYCISTIEKGNNLTGEIDSVYIDESHRESGIGTRLIQNAIDWLTTKGTVEQKLLVGVGNEKVLDFYKQLDFYPLHIVLQRIYSQPKL
jgi:ribosomal protein S18 acetylase RimI-like enzyme